MNAAPDRICSCHFEVEYMALDEAGCNEQSGRREPPDREKSKDKNKYAAKEKAMSATQAGLPARTLESTPKFFKDPKNKSKTLA